MKLGSVEFNNNWQPVLIPPEDQCQCYWDRNEDGIRGCTRSHCPCQVHQACYEREEEIALYDIPEDPWEGADV